MCPACCRQLLGGFFVVNLFLAVVFDEFLRSKELALSEARCVRALYEVT